MGVKIKYAKHTYSGDIKHASQVSNGKSCGCICVECGEELLAANKGKKQAPHFRHLSESDCKGGPETALHLMAKQILKESSSILIAENRIFDYDESRIEQYLVDGYKPDAQLVAGNGDYWVVEIVVTHKIEEHNIRRIKEGRINCLEIDLSRVDREISPSKLRSIVLSETSNRKVIYTSESSLSGSRSSFRSEKKEDWFKKNWGYVLIAIVFFALFSPAGTAKRHA